MNEKNGNWFRDYQKWNIEKESLYSKYFESNEENIL